MSNLNDNFSFLFKLSFSKNWMSVKLKRGVFKRVHSNLFYHSAHEFVLDVGKSLT